MKNFLLFLLFLFLILFENESFAQCPINVSVVSTPDVSLAIVCKSTPIQLEANPSSGVVNPQYIWVVDGDTILSTDTIINLLANNQNVQVYMATTTGCTQDTVSATIQIQTVIIASTVTPVPSCDLTQADILISSTGGLSPYSYNLVGIGTSTTGVYTSVLAGTYTLYITDDQGCNDTNQITVIPVPKDLVPTITPQITECNQTTADVTITTTGGLAPYSYDLQGIGQNGNGFFAAVPSGSYTLYITDNDGCIDTNVVSIVPFTCPPPVPTEVMTPNGDGINDTWVINNIGYYPENEVFIFDRWGQRVYHKKGYKNKDGWEAKYIGVKMPVSTYYYILKITPQNSDELIFKGPISVFR